MIKDKSCLYDLNKPFNLYTDRKLRGYKTIFFVKDETDLDNIWFHMNHFEELTKGDIFGFLSSLYFFLSYLKSDEKITDKDESFEFVIEESDLFFYWTTSSEYFIYIVNHHNIFFSEFNFKITNTNLTFKLYKYKHFEDKINHVTQTIVTDKNNINKTVTKTNTNNIDDAPQKSETIKTPTKITSSSIDLDSFEEQYRQLFGNSGDEDRGKKKQVYSFIPKPKLLQLQQIGEELTGTLLEIENGYEFNRQTVESIIMHLRQIAKILHNYKETYTIADSMEDLALFIKHHIEDVVEFEIEDIELFETLFANFNTWLLLSFFDGIENIDEYNSIIANDVREISQRVNDKLDNE